MPFRIFDQDKPMMSKFFDFFKKKNDKWPPIRKGRYPNTKNTIICFYCSKDTGIDPSFMVVPKEGLKCKYCGNVVAHPPNTYL